MQEGLRLISLAHCACFKSATIMVRHPSQPYVAGVRFAPAVISSLIWKLFILVTLAAGFEPNFGVIDGASASLDELLGTFESGPEQ
jgi:hypothetical protein